MALVKAENTKTTDQEDYEHEKEEQILKLKEDIDKQSFNLSADMGLHDSKELVKMGDEVIQSHDGSLKGGRLSEYSRPTYIRAIDALGSALREAEACESLSLQARINAQMGFIHYLCL